MKVILTIDYPCIIAAQLIVRHGGNLIECAKLALDEQALGVQVQLKVLAVHDLFHGTILKLNIILGKP